MKQIIINRLKSNGMIAALCIIAAAVILRLAHPPFGIAPAAFLAWPFLFEGLRRSRFPVIDGLAFGALYSLMISSWIMETLLVQYGRGFFFSLAFFIAAAGLVPSLAWGVFAAAVRGAITGTVDAFNSQGRVFMTGARVAAAFTVCEWLRKSFSPEHGWGEAAASLASAPQFFGIAPITGAGGIAFMMVFCGFLVWAAGIALSKRDKKTGMMYIASAAAVIVALFLAGSLRIAIAPDEMNDSTIRIAVIHPGINQSRRWRSGFDASVLAVYRRMSLDAFGAEEPGRGPRLLVWPETAVTAPMEGNPAFREALRDIAQRTGAWILLGSPSFRGDGDNRRYYNSVYLVDPSGNIAGRYDKIHLLPFAERRYAWMELLADYDSGLYAPGAALPLPVIRDVTGGADIVIGVFICYEAGIPALAGGQARRGARLFANISNDAWFGESSESLQQITLLQLRCAEFGVPGVRSSGYGAAAAVDRYGRVILSTGVDGETILSAPVAVPRGGPTFYARFQGWFEIVCALFLLAVFIRRR